MPHLDLIPWEQLCEADRDMVRHNVRQISELLPLQGYKICVASGSEGHDAGP
jgi:spore germination protein YaaH